MRIDAIGCGHKHDSAFLIDRPNGAGDYLLLLTKTPAAFRISGEDIHAPAGSFILYTPEQPQYYYAVEDIYIDDWLHFTPETDGELSLIRELAIPLNRPVSAFNAAQISSLMRYMMYENNSGNLHYRKTIDCCFEMLLYKLNEAVTTSAERSRTALFMDDPGRRVVADSRLGEIRHTIYAFPGREWRALDMARELTLSESYFQHLYRRVFGISVNKDVMKARVEKAAELLSNGDPATVKEVGVFVGYRSDSYFSRHFKSVYGMTPAQYRRTKAKGGALNGKK